MRYGRHLALGVGAYILALVVLAPAMLVDAAAAHASGGVLRIAGARGTIWSGTGELELIDPRSRAGMAKKVTWHLLPSSLLRGLVVYDVELADTAGSARVTITPSRIEFANAVIDVPAAAIGLGAPKLVAAQLTGDLSLSIPHLVVDGSGARGGATVRWRNVGSSLTPVAPLGEYELRIEGDDAGVHATLLTLKGPLELVGTGTWRRQAAPVFSATARVAPDYVERIAPLLRVIAVESGDGTFRVVL